MDMPENHASYTGPGWGAQQCIHHLQALLPHGCQQVLHDLDAARIAVEH